MAEVKTELTQTDQNRLITTMEEIYKELLISYEFKPGQMVEWKQGLKNRVKPSLHEPAIVISVLEEPIFDTDRDSGTPYFKEPLDLVIGVFQEEEDANMFFFYVDKRRLQPFLSKN
jgi:hypothetical protein